MGERHLFIRFEKCNIHCHYCDELDKSGKDLSIDATLDQVTQVEQEEGPHRFVSLTGGEPLFYLPFLKKLCPLLIERQFNLYLETNGILTKALVVVLPWLKVIAMDMKPESVTKDGSFIREHEAFLRVAREKEVFIKMVISKEIDIQEFRDLCMVIDKIHRQTPLILQPISEANREGHEDPALMHLLGELQQIASAILPDVRIVPRLHRILKIR